MYEVLRVAMTCLPMCCQAYLATQAQLQLMGEEPLPQQKTLRSRESKFIELLLLISPPVQCCIYGIMNTNIV